MVTVHDPHPAPYWQPAHSLVSVVMAVDRLETYSYLFFVVAVCGQLVAASAILCLWLASCSLIYWNIYSFCFASVVRFSDLSASGCHYCPVKVVLQLIMLPYLLLCCSDWLYEHNSA